MSLRETGIHLMEHGKSRRRLLAFCPEGLPFSSAPGPDGAWRRFTAEAARRDMARRKGSWPVTGEVRVDVGIDLREPPAEALEVAPLAQRVV